MGKVITFINMKGGVGKTHLIVNIGYTLSKRFNKKVLLIDMDPQMNATQYSLSYMEINNIIKNESTKTVLGVLLGNNQTIPTKIENLETFQLLPTTLSIIKYNEKLHENIDFLRTYIKQIRHKYDYILIDSPPTISDFTTSSIVASDQYIVPVQHYLSIFGLLTLEYYLTQILAKKYQIPNNMNTGIIFNNVHTNQIAFKHALEMVMENPTWKKNLYSTIIPTSANGATAASQDSVSKRFFLNQTGKYSLSEPILELSKEFVQKTINR